MRPFPGDLLKSFDPVDGEGVVAFVGSGPSIDAGLPDWASLLKAVAREVGVEDEVEPFLEDGRFLDVAQFLVREKSELAIQEKVAGVIDESRLGPGDLHRLIVELPLKGIITTNYDLLLSEADSKRSFERPISHQSSPLRRLLQKRFMLHLHGHVDDPSSIIISKAGYDRFARGEVSEAEQFVRTLFHNHTVLCLGFGFRDANIDAILRDLQQKGVVTGWKLFSLVATADPERPDRVVSSALAHRDVIPIYVEDAGDHGVAAMSEWLARLNRALRRMSLSRRSPAAESLSETIKQELEELLVGEAHRPDAESALRSLEDRPDLELLCEQGLRPGNVSDLLYRIDSAELRQVLIKVNKANRNPRFENALSCLPP